MAIAVLAYSGSSDEDSVALQSDEGAAGETAHQRFIDRRVVEGGTLPGRWKNAYS